MAELETLQESQQESPEIARPDLLMAIPAPQGSDALPPTIAKVEAACKLLSTPCQVMLALPAETAQEVPALLPNTDPDNPAAHPLPFVNYPLPAVAPGMIPWLPNVAAYRSIALFADNLGARACTLLGMD